MRLIRLHLNLHDKATEAGLQTRTHEKEESRVLTACDGLMVRSVRLQAARQEEVLYRARYQLVMLEKKADQLAGTRSKEESLALQATIQQQTQALEAAQADTVLVQGQVQKAEEDLGALLANRQPEQ